MLATIPGPTLFGSQGSEFLKVSDEMGDVGTFAALIGNVS
jgi:hypothetical protein